MGKPGKAFTLHHCWKKLKNDERWKNRELYEFPRRSKSSVGEATIVDDDASSDDDDKIIPTPNSVATTKRPDGRKFAEEKDEKTEMMI